MISFETPVVLNVLKLLTVAFPNRVLVRSIDPEFAVINHTQLLVLDCRFIRLLIEVCAVRTKKLHKCALRNEITKRQKMIEEQNNIKVKETKSEELTL